MAVLSTNNLIKLYILGTRGVLRLFEQKRIRTIEMWGLFRQLQHLQEVLGKYCLSVPTFGENEHGRHRGLKICPPFWTASSPLEKSWNVT